MRTIYFFFNDTATTEIYTLSLHDALPIFTFRVYPADLIEENKWRAVRYGLDGYMIDFGKEEQCPARDLIRELVAWLDRKSTRLNSSHANISYAVFCLKKKTKLLLPSCTFT